MSIRNAWLISILLITISLHAQNFSGTYKINDLLKRIDTCKKTMAVNFWATWCKPCVEELPAFDSLCKQNSDFKILLVSLDFKEEIDKKVKPFLEKHKISCECVVLDEINGNDYINLISKDWSGAIPATLFVRKDKRILVEKKMNSTEILEKVKEVEK
jgi:thiol-disulfide isomerase/thioredoxin